MGTLTLLAVALERVVTNGDGQGARYGYIWAASNLVCVGFFYIFMPEMKGRSLEELDEIFAARVPARKFQSYQCLIREAARIDAVNVKGKQ